MFTRSKKAKSTGRSIIEPLENRTLFTVAFGSNIILNPGAETFTGTANGSTVITPADWTANSTPTVVAYGTSGFPTATGPGPSSRGKVFFAGGDDGGESDFFQTIDLSSIASSVATGDVKFSLSAYLGGYSTQGDNASVFLNFQGSDSQAFIGPETETQRGGVTGLFLQSTTGTIPKGTTAIQVQIHFEEESGVFDDGYADNLNLTLTNPAATGTVSGTVFNDVNGDGIRQTATEPGVSGVKVTLEKGGVVVTNTTTTATGAYTFSNVAAGTYTVLETTPATYRITTTNPLTAVVTAGHTTANENFGISHTVVISGLVFNDVNGDGVRQTATEPGLAGVKITLKNGTTVVATTTTSATGTFSFVNEPPATYTVLETVPSTYRATTTNPLTFAAAAGSTNANKNFGVSQTVLIEGTVFNDANGNKTKDPNEKGIAGVTVYLDFNNNDQFDPSFELSTKTDANGNYQFILPFGTYILREVMPSGFTIQTITPKTLTLAKGATSINNLFGDEA